MVTVAPFFTLPILAYPVPGPLRTFSVLETFTVPVRTSLVGVGVGLTVGVGLKVGVGVGVGCTSPTVI